MRHCPECQTPLEHKSFKVFHCWVCPEGHGTLYPAGELENIARSTSGLDDVELTIWGDEERFSVITSNLVSPDGARMLHEIRDRDHMTIAIYGDPETHSLWIHTGEEEKLIELIEEARSADSVSSYIELVAEEAVSLFDDEQPITESTGHFLTSLKLLGERIARAFPPLTL